MDQIDPQILAAISDTKPRNTWTPDVPISQPYFSFSKAKNAWLPSSEGLEENPPHTFPTKVTLLSWNIDFMLPLASERMNAAVAHLRSVLWPASDMSHSPSSPPQKPSVILLQEILTSDIDILQSTPWIRSYFHLTDLSAEMWLSNYYGTCTLVDRRLPIVSVFRAHYQLTRMQRDGLFVDLAVATKPARKVLRVCNTHLESLALRPPFRPAQLTAAAKHMHEAYASVLAGDLNAIEDFDRHLHTDNGLKDAYLELGGSEDSEDGYTWGQQAATNLREQFGCSRMDKVLYCGALHVERVERFGVDVEVEGDENKEVLKKLGLEKGWITDHLGVKADLIVTDDGRR